MSPPAQAHASFGSTREDLPPWERTDIAWKARVDFVRLAGPLYASGAGVNNPAQALAAATLSGAGGVAATSDPAPDFGAAGGLPSTGFARVRVLSGAVLVAWGDAPTAAEGASLRLEAGEREYLPITAGQRISFLEAADAPSSPSASSGSGAAASAAFTSRPPPASPTPPPR